LAADPIGSVLVPGFPGLRAGDVGPLCVEVRVFVSNCCNLLTRANAEIAKKIRSALMQIPAIAFPRVAQFFRVGAKKSTTPQTNPPTGDDQQAKQLRAKHPTRLSARATAGDNPAMLTTRVPETDPCCLSLNRADLSGGW